MGSLRSTVLLLCALVALGAAPPAGAQKVAVHGDTLAGAMNELSEDTEETLHWLMHGDFPRLEHMSIELRRSLDLNISIAQTQGLSPAFLDLLLEMRDHAEKLGEEARDGNLKESGEEFLKIVELCMECHVESP